MLRVGRSRLGLVVTCVAALTAPVAPTTLAQDGGPTLAGCPVLPADDIWNTPVDTLPVHASSDTWIATVGQDDGLKADFGSGEWEGAPIGIPWTTVSGDQPRVEVTFDYADESDPGPYPIPVDAPIEGGPDSDGDRHILVLDRDACTLYELYDAHPNDDGTWHAGSGALFDLTSSALRPDGWTSTDAAGLPVLPGLVRYDEVAAGEIRHALRFTVPDTQRAYVWPARHFASDIEDPAYPPMGARFRLRADLDVSPYPPQVQVILRALQRYGMILADNGSAWYLSGAPDPGWDDELLRALLEIHGSDLEAVGVSSLMVDPDTGQASSGSHTPAPAAALSPVEPDLYVDIANGSDTRDGSRDAPFSTIQDAIDAAVDGATIAVAAGTYPENVRIERRTVHLYGGFDGDFATRDPATNLTTLQGGGTDSVVTLLDAGTSTIDGLRITGGASSTVPEYGELGAGIYVQGGAPTIAHALIEGNDARRPGAADTDILGGGIFAGDSDLTITDSVIRRNTAGRGGGIAAAGGRVRIIGNTIEDNTGISDHGGGVYLAGPDIEVSRNRIAGNEIGREMGYGWGGGIIVYGQGSRAVLSYDDITGNSAPSVGGGMFIDDGAVAVLDHELVHDNVCPYGGTTGGVGIYVDGYDTIGSTVTLDHVTVAGHDCETQGGNALYVEAYSVVTVTNSILWGNGGDDVFVDGTSHVTATYTLSQETLEGEGYLSTDPLFVDPASADYHLAPDSPAIDAADPAAPFNAEPPPNGGRADLGAYGDTPEATTSRDR